MVRVVLFHHAQGLTQGVTAFAELLRAAGHEVHTPDLFDGETFDTLDAGMAHVEEIGFGEIIERGARAADAVGGTAVYAGFSLGVVPAQMLAQTRPGALGAVLCYSCVPVSEFGVSWPTDVPVQSTAWTPTRSSLAKVTSTQPVPSSSPRHVPSCSCTQVISTTSPTVLCPPTTPTPPSCCCSGSSTSWPRWSSRSGQLRIEDQEPNRQLAIGREID